MLKLSLASLLVLGSTFYLDVRFKIVRSTLTRQPLMWKSVLVEVFYYLSALWLLVVGVVNLWGRLQAL